MKETIDMKQREHIMPCLWFIYTWVNSVQGLLSKHVCMINTCFWTLYFLTSIGTLARESSLEADAQLTRDLHSLTHNQTQNFNFSFA